MNANEHAFWNRIRDKFPGHVQRLENMTGAGVPDVNVCHMGKEYWIELKIWTPGPGLLIRKEQWAWANRRVLAGGNCFLIFYREESKMIFCVETIHLKIKAYGTNGKYICPIDANNLPIVFGCLSEDLRTALKTNLFT